MPSNEHPDKNDSLTELKAIKDFYKTLEKQRVYNDKFFENKHPQEFLSAKRNDNEDDNEEFIKGNGGYYEKEPFVDQTVKHNVKTDKQFVYDYLSEERGLSKSLIDKMIEQDLIRCENSANYKYIEFAWKKPSDLSESNDFELKNQKVVGADRMYFETDKNGKVHRRSENGKQIVKNSESGYGFNVKTRTGKDVLFVFEAPVDALSYINANGSELKGVDATFLSLGGVSKSNSIQEFLSKQHAKVSDFKDIVLCVDNDKAGRKMIGDFTADITNKADSVQNPEKYRHHVFVKVPNVDKDWNDTLKGMRDFNRSPQEAEKKHPNIQYDLKKKTRYDINDYILQQTKKATHNIINRSGLIKTVDSLSNMYDNFKKNNNINFYGKDYSTYKKNLFAYNDDFKEFMTNFGENMPPKELKKYVNHSLENHKLSPSEKNNIKAIQDLYSKNQITPAVNMISKLSPTMSLEGLNAISTINNNYRKEHNMPIKENNIQNEPTTNKKHSLFQDKKHKYEIKNFDLKGSEMFLQTPRGYMRVGVKELCDNLNNNKFNDGYMIQYKNGFSSQISNGKEMFEKLKNKDISQIYKDDRKVMLKKLGINIDSTNKHDLYVDPKNDTRPKNKVNPKNDIRPKNKVNPKNDIRPKNKVNPKNDIRPKNKVNPKNDIRSKNNKQQHIDAESNKISEEISKATTLNSFDNNSSKMDNNNKRNLLIDNINNMNDTDIIDKLSMNNNESDLQNIQKKNRDRRQQRENTYRKSQKQKNSMKL
ncbi:hypothetical protein DY052_05980 [Apilactobacillus timberlakei]|uniref:toprim domain-containing protein n=1 Tax=Apilactobacillus timberlakei TaxID=2008380 RepID=UPI00112EE38F|nr:toprim domain-containing protein [Apilactobacillus timberlakei]TPR14972.1 hypothetical protein DY052_05980 [Apilactobacillus timberlakei]